MTTEPKNQVQIPILGSAVMSPERMAEICERIRGELAEIHSFVEAKKVLEFAEALQAYLKIKDAQEESIDHSNVILIYAKRCAARVLEEMKDRGERRQVGNKKGTETGTIFERTPTLKDLGVKKRELQEWNALNSEPEESLQEIIEECKEEKGLSPHAVVQKIKAKKREETSQVREASQAPLEADPLVELYCARFQDVVLAAESVDWIITDPPYGAEWVDTLKEFSTWAHRVLRVGGSALVMIGQHALHESLWALSSSLTYHWLMSYTLELGSPTPLLLGLKVFNGWKPVVWLCKGPTPNTTFTNADRYISKREEREKDVFAWQQGQGFFDWTVEKFTRNDHVVCDPFLGSGTTGRSARRYRRHFIGIEMDPKMFDLAKSRILEPDPLTGTSAADMLHVE